MRLLIIGLVWMGGAVSGWDTAAATHKTHPATSHSKEMASFSLPQTSTLVIVPVPSLISSEAQRAQELARLDTEPAFRSAGKGPAKAPIGTTTLNSPCGLLCCRRWFERLILIAGLFCLASAAVPFARYERLQQTHAKPAQKGDLRQIGNSEHRHLCVRPGR